MPQTHGHRAALAIAGSLGLVLANAPGLATAVPAPWPAGVTAASPEDCALPGAPEGLHAGIPTPDGFSPTHGDVSALTLFIDFPDAEAELSTEERYAEFFPATSDYFADSSYGRLDYRPAPVHRWLRMSQPFEEYGIDRGVGWHPDDPQGYNRLMREISEAVEDEVDFDEYDLVNVLATPNAGPSALETVLSVSFPGRPLITTDSGPLRNISFIWSTQPGETPHRVLVHENGHSFGLPDLYWTGDGPAPRLTGHWDVMEQDWGPSNDLMAWHKWKLEWLVDEQVDCVPDEGTTEHVIHPLGEDSAGAPGGHTSREATPVTAGESDEGEGDARDGDAATGTDGPAEPGGTDEPSGTDEDDTRLVAIPTGPSDVLTLEVRTPTDLDRAVCHSGVLVTRVDTAAPSGEAPMRVVDANPGSDGCAELADPQIDPDLTDAAHTPGDTFRDEELGVEVTVLDAEEDGPHRVRVTRW